MKNIDSVYEILNSDLTDQWKLYWIQSYLLGWTSEEQISEIVKERTIYMGVDNEDD